MTWRFFISFVLRLYYFLLVFFWGLKFLIFAFWEFIKDLNCSLREMLNVRIDLGVDLLLERWKDDK